jgi:hypothetical protein
MCLYMGKKCTHVISDGSVVKGVRGAPSGISYPHYLRMLNNLYLVGSNEKL